MGTFSFLCLCRSNAEKQLLELRRLPAEKLFELVRVVVASTRDVGARFHGVQTLRQGLLEQWPGLPMQVKISIRDWSVKQALGQRDEIVRSQLLALCAILNKRLYLEQTYEQKCAFFQQLRQHTAQAGELTLFNTQASFFFNFDHIVDPVIASSCHWDMLISTHLLTLSSLPIISISSIETCNRWSWS